MLSPAFQSFLYYTLIFSAYQRLLMKKREGGLREIAKRFPWVQCTHAPYTVTEPPLHRLKKQRKDELSSVDIYFFVLQGSTAHPANFSEKFDKSVIVSILFCTKLSLTLFSISVILSLGIRMLITLPDFFSSGSPFSSKLVTLTAKHFCSFFLNKVS